MSESNRSTFYDRFYLWILIASLVSIYPITLSVIKSEETNNNNIKQWLPENNFDETKIYAEFRAHFGTDEYAIVSWKGCTLTDPRLPEFASLARNYENESGEKLFAKVTTGPELLEKLQAKPFDLSESLARQRLESILIGKDGKSSAAVIELTEAGDNDRREAIASLREILVDDPYGGRRGHQCGSGCREPEGHRFACRLLHVDCTYLCRYQFFLRPRSSLRTLDPGSVVQLHAGHANFLCRRL